MEVYKTYKGEIFFMKDKFKNIISKKNVKIEKLKNNLENTKLMASQYLEIVNRLKKNKQISTEDYNYIKSNSGILQLKLMKLKPQLGVIHYRRPFNLDVIPNYEVIGNFPILMSNRGTLDEAFSIIPAIESALSTYVIMVEDVLKNNEKLKLLLNRDKESKSKWKIIKEDKKSLFSIFLIPVYIASLLLLFPPVSFIYGIILNVVSVFLILLVSFLSKLD